MLAEGRTARHTLSFRRALLVLLVVLLFVAGLVPSSRADTPTPKPNGDASRTVTWTMNTPTNLSLDGVSLAGGHAELPWVTQNLTWTDASGFAANGTPGPGVVANASGLGLRSNWTNSVRNPTFDNNGSWLYASGPSRNVTAQWNGSLGVGELDANWTGDQVVWSGMDDVTSLNWLGYGAMVQQNETVPAPRQGRGSLGLEVSSLTQAPSYVAAVNQSVLPQNWSASNRLVLWIFTNVSVAATFNLTAREGATGPQLHTVGQPLSAVPGWQEVTVDLDQLGAAAARSSLYFVTLRFNPVVSFAANTWFDIDDLRLGSARIFNETARFSQLLLKANATTPLPGSARLSFAWSLVSTAGVSTVQADVTVGPPGSPDYAAPLASASSGTWHAFSGDVSAATAAAGAYNVTFLLTVSANTTAAYEVALLIDSVTLVFPQTNNGTFSSNVLTMGTASQYLALSWSGVAPSATSVQVGIRTGNNSTPGSSSWSGWQTLSSFGPVALTVPGAYNFQIRIGLNTTNASVSPLAQTLSLTTRHRQGVGNLISDLWPAASDFLSWRTIGAHLKTPNGTSIQFWVGNASSLVPVPLGANLTTYTGGPVIRWRATFSTSDGLETPFIINVTLVYEYLGPPARVVLTKSGVPVATGAVVNVSSGQYVPLSVLVYDVGSHPLPTTDYTLDWEISNATGGSVYPNGTYAAGRPGVYVITATVAPPGGGTLVHASLVVNVTAGASSSTAPFGFWDAWPIFVIVAAALVGFSAYEILIRRLFAIDDVFLIAKDGRLILHNTRRMRADRDEDILSGMLTAIMAFLRDQDPEENGELKRFQVGGKTTLLERGDHVYLSAIYSGRVPGWAGKDLHRFMTDLEGRFGDAFATWNGSPEDLRDLKEYMQRFVTRVRYRGDGRRHLSET